MDIDQIKPINIAHIVLSLEIGGLEVLVSQMTIHMERYGFHPIIVCLDRTGVLAEQVRSSGVTVICINRRGGLLDIRALYRLIKELRRYRIQIIHTHNQEAHFYGAIASLFVPKNLLIHTQHGLEPPFTIKKRLKLIITGRLIDRFIGVSENVVEVAINKGWVRKKQVLTILNGVDTDRFTPDAEDRGLIREQLGLEDDAIVFICVARMSPVKNHSLLIEAFNKVFEQENRARLILVGGGPEQEAIRQRIKQLGLDAVVLMLGESNIVDNLLHAANVFVLASDSEGINVSLLEAMSTGIAPIVTDVGGNGEVINDGEQGFLVRPRDSSALAKAMIEKGGDKPLLNRVGKNARSRIVSNFSIKTMVKDYIACYKDIRAVYKNNPC